MPAAPNKPTILCVDDEPAVLEGLTLLLKREFVVLTAPGAASAMEILGSHDDVAVVVADMRMPRADGATFLSWVRQRWPDITRILLTGEGGREPAVAAVNEGQVFRFLTKPCAPAELLGAIRGGYRQFQLVTNEKILLQQTLLGSIQALVDILGIVNPLAFGRASRVKRLCLDLQRQLGDPASWELEAAALLSQIGYVSLPLELVEKIYDGQVLNAEETQQCQGVSKIAPLLLRRIPRLDRVVEILEAVALLPARGGVESDQTAKQAAILAAVLEVDGLVSSGKSAADALSLIRSRAETYSDDVLQAFSSIIGDTAPLRTIRELPLRDVTVGMILMTDVRTPKGALLIARDYEISEGFLQRLRNFKPALLNTIVRVSILSLNATASQPRQMLTSRSSA